MKQTYSKPTIEELGSVQELTAANNAILRKDVPDGTNGDPGLPGNGIIGSR